MKKCGLLGYGYWGEILSKYIEESDLFDLKLVYSSKLSIPKGTQNINDFFNSDIEVVFIALPSELHYNYVKLFLNQGIHVFCEKPMSSEPDQVFELFSIAKEKVLSLYVNYIYTHSPSIKFIKNNLSKIGEIQHLDFLIKQYGKFYKDQNVFEVLGCHLLSVYFYWFEKFEPEYMEVIAQTHYKKETALVQNLTIKKNKHTAIFNASLLNTTKERKIQIIGEKGIIVFNPLIKNSVIIYNHNFKEVEEIEIKSFDETNNISCAIYHFNQMIDNKSKNNEKLVMNISKVLKKTKNGKG